MKSNPDVNSDTGIMKSFPVLQGLNSNSTYAHVTELETTGDERDRIAYLISQKEAELDYPSEIWVRATIWSTDEVPTDTPSYTEINTEDLEQFPSIQKAINQPYPFVDRWYGISSDKWDSFLEFTNGYNEEYGAVFLKFGNQVYLISDMYDMRSYLKIKGEYYAFSIGLVG